MPFVHFSSAVSLKDLEKTYLKWCGEILDQQIALRRRVPSAYSFSRQDVVCLYLFPFHCYQLGLEQKK